jgi:(2Fe-2S) ferredoxin
MNKPQKILVCIGRGCRKYDAELVLANFKQNFGSEIEIIPVACLGQCGNGPMVLIQPEEIWYWQVAPSEVPLIVQAIVNQQPVQEMLYPKFHS